MFTWLNVCYRCLSPQGKLWLRTPSPTFPRDSLRPGMSGPGFFELLLLPWVPVCVRFCVHPLKVKSLFPPVFSSVQFSHSVMSDSLRPHGLQHTRLPCPSPTPGTYSKSCPLHRWCHPTISSSVVPSPSAPSPSQHQSLFQWVNSSHEVAKVLEFKL